jgi:hypothetical protein
VVPRPGQVQVGALTDPAERHAEHAAHGAERHTEHAAHGGDRHTEHAAHGAERHTEHAAHGAERHTEHAAHGAERHTEHAAHGGDRHTEHAAHGAERHTEHAAHGGDRHTEHAAHGAERHTEHAAHGGDRHTEHAAHGGDRHTEHAAHGAERHTEHAADGGDRPSEEPLHPEERRSLEAVQIHTDSRAARSAQVVGAEAYALPGHIVFGAARYRPTSPAGRRLLTHELAHALTESPTTGTAVLRRQADAGVATPDPSVAAPTNANPNATVSNPATNTAASTWPDWVGTPLTPDQQRTVNAVLASRNNQPVRPDLAHRTGGFQYGGKAGSLSPNASRYLRIAMREYWAGEGGVAGINTWDTPAGQPGNFTLGPGMLNAGAASLMRKWFDADATVAQQCRDELGVWVTPSLEWRVIDHAGTIRRGDDARSLLNDPAILSRIMNLAEGGHGGPLDRAEQNWVTDHDLAQAPPEAEVASWDDAAIACCLHIQHGAPAYSWSQHRSLYLQTHGDPLLIASICASLGVFKRLGNAAIGPVLVTSQWSELVYSGPFARWGVGGGQPGYLKHAIDAAGQHVSGTAAELGAKSELVGHALYQTGVSGSQINALDIG